MADLVVDYAVPHIAIRDNLTRGRDGGKAGEKRLARRRKLPIHPELIRLGFLDYVAAISGEGHLALFPELYILDSKRGGAQFYDRAWLHLVHWIEDRLEQPRNDAGKGPDIHSNRMRSDLSRLFQPDDAALIYLPVPVFNHYDRNGRLIWPRNHERMVRRQARGTCRCWAFPTMRSAMRRRRLRR